MRRLLHGVGDHPDRALGGFKVSGSDDQGNHFGDGMRVGKFANALLDLDAFGGSCLPKDILERLIKIGSQLVGPEHRFQIRSLTIPGRLKYYLEEHQKIVEALKRRDVEQAARLSQKHAENILKNILIYEDQEGEGDKDA